ncbi:MAG: hypothetical protein ABSA72_00295 [Nitrososphaerales archaeon]|jgi:hypothetical protein
MAVDAAEVKRLTDEFKSSAGFKVHSDINNDRRNLRIVSRNKDELVHSVAALNKLLAPGPAGGPNESPALALALEEVARRLESFVSSAYDLIDYTRRRCRKVYGQVDFGKEVQSEIDRRFIYEPDFKIAQGLRSVSAHVGTLQASLSLAPGKERAKDAPFKIQSKELLGWDEWNDNQRSLLASMEDVDIQELAGRYFKKIEEFYAWLWKRESEVHSAELAEAERLRLRAKEAYDKLFPPAA